MAAHKKRGVRAMQSVFITGGTGFVGRSLITELLQHGYAVRALARPGSEKKLPHGCQVIQGDALDKRSLDALRRAIAASP